MSAAISGTLNSARLAAHRLGVPVRLVDSGTASQKFTPIDATSNADTYAPKP